MHHESNMNLERWLPLMEVSGFGRNEETFDALEKGAARVLQ